MKKNKNYLTLDGVQAAAEVSYAFSEVAGIFPISPSSGMAELVDAWSATGKKNMFGQPVKVIEMQSEAGAIGVVHGALSTGSFSSSYTASQGLLLMIPNLYKIAGELLPCVLHVTARAVATHALSIFGDHSDVMACRQTGFALLASSNVQEVMDLGAVAHLSTVKGRVPFIHFFDGYRTSHEIQKISVLDYDDLHNLLDKDAAQAFKDRALNPENPMLKGTAQNPDIFFQVREASNKYYENLPSIVEDYMEEINKLTGKNYKLFNYYGAEDAEKIIVAMGSVCDTIESTVDYLNSRGEKVGFINVHLYRPFVKEKFLEAVPNTVKKVAVLDRTKESGSLGEPLYLDICASFLNSDKKLDALVGGRYGLASKETTPAQIISVFNNLDLPEPKNNFTIGIVDDVTFKSLNIGEEVDVVPEGTISCKFWGLGSDGTIGANKNTIKIIGDNTDLYAQGYFSYDSRKSGNYTISHLRFGKSPIKASYLIQETDFVACHQASYLTKFDLLDGLKKNGKFLLNCPWTGEELEKNIPNKMKKYMAENNIEFYIIDAVKIAKELGLGIRFNAVLQACFFKISNIIDIEKAIEYMKTAITKTYGKKGEKVVSMNHQAVDKGIEFLNKVDVPKSWANISLEDEFEENKPYSKITLKNPEYVSKILDPVNTLKGNSLPVSIFLGHEDGVFETGTAAYEKRGISTQVPEWKIENCIQCNQCAFVCPHAVIRPFLLNEEENENAPDAFETLQANGKGLESYKYRIQISTLDCTGCGACVSVCPAKEKALVMTPIDTQKDQIKNWDYAINLSHKENPMKKETLKGSQFEQPLIEFSGACAGCGETPYAKLITQLFGDRMYIANATGCTSIWGGSAPSFPYTKNHEGKGPVWANSLFENNAEFGLGMLAGARQQREILKEKVIALMNSVTDETVKSACQNWLDTMMQGEASKETSANLVKAIENLKSSNESAKYIFDNQKNLVKKSQWLFGGDGWAYDIGFGGLDHVLASGEDINVFVFDTEVYSNTGGQSSKATPMAAIAKFASSGKRIAKKDLGQIAMSYGYIYVAQVALGADKNQLIKALVEAESYPGPSLIIGYTPCIEHGIDMSDTLNETIRAVESGYWHLYRFNPALKEQGKNPFILDSKEPKSDFKTFLSGETRYSALKNLYPKDADELFSLFEENSKNKYEKLRDLADK